MSIHPLADKAAPPDLLMFAEAHDAGAATVLWCYMRNNTFKKGKDYHVVADLTGQASHLNRRAGGMGLISGRKAFQRPMKEGMALLNAVQDVYLCKEVTVA